MDKSSKSDRKLMQDAGFSEELKRKLEERIAQTAFKAENQQAFSEVNMPVRFSTIMCHSYAKFYSRPPEEGHETTPPHSLGLATSQSRTLRFAC